MRREGRSTHLIARDLLEAIAKDDLYSAVLDTRKEPVAA